MKKIIVASIFLLSFCKGHSQVVDTLYYNQYWQLTNQELHEYYRVGLIDTAMLNFVGAFSDYWKSGNVLLSGSYNKLGQREGKFSSYHLNGKPHSDGEYIGNKMIGEWRFYYENGDLFEAIKFFEDDFSVLTYNDVNGNKLLVNGTGSYVREFYSANGAIDYLYGYFTDGKRSGIWEYKSNNFEVKFREEYEKGRLKKGKFLNSNGSSKYTETKFLKSMFDINSLNTPEYFECSFDAYIEDYPYIDGLPKRPLLVSPDGVLTTVDKPASYLAGMPDFYKIIQRNIKYPAQARRMGIMGSVFIEFIVTEEGDVANVKVIRGIGGGCDEEAIRVVRNSAKWTPPMHEGKLVKQKIVLPITFKLG